eukprot:5771058-Prymnesium_polylepis.2
MARCEAAPMLIEHQKKRKPAATAAAVALYVRSGPFHDMLALKASMGMRVPSFSRTVGAPENGGGAAPASLLVALWLLRLYTASSELLTATYTPAASCCFHTISFSPPGVCDATRAAKVPGTASLLSAAIVAKTAPTYAAALLGSTAWELVLVEVAHEAGRALQPRERLDIRHRGVRAESREDSLRVGLGWHAQRGALPLRDGRQRHRHRGVHRRTKERLQPR